MSKKEFKERCSFHTYTGGSEKHIAIYFDWSETDEGRGYKYAVAANKQNSTQKELFNALYDWVVKGIQPSWWIRYKFAETDAKRFKVPLALNF